MKLTVKNLGVVSHAEIDLSKDLLIFTGENNSGKTYLAYTIYGLNSESGIRDNLTIYESEKVPKANSIVSDFSYDRNEFPINFNLKDNLEKFGKIVEKKLKENLPRFFATDKKDWKSSSFQLVFDDFDYERLFNTHISRATVVGRNPITEEDIWLKKLKESYDISISPKSIFHDTSFIDIYLDILIRPTTKIFTAERAGINLFSKELSITKSRLFSTIIQSSNGKNLLELLAQRLDRYPLPIRDNLRDSENHDARRKRIGDFAHLANELEAEFLNGKITVTEEGDLQFSTNNNGKRLEIHMTSSTVKSLAPIVFYLRHTAKFGDFIIIDEPELNLHPDNQRKIARFIGRLINEGFKVLISTHSDYIVRELNNLIMLSHGFATKKEDTLRLLKDYDYNENELIGADKVGAYLFRIGMPVENVVVEDTGFNVATVDEEIRNLNQSSQDIYFTLFDE